jgi:hypothetical protein
MPGIEPPPAQPAHAPHSYPPVVESASVSGGVEASTLGASVAKLASDHPELVIGAAFVGGLLLATILKRLAR